jgi:Uma2 family endonuclease
MSAAILTEPTPLDPADEVDGERYELIDGVKVEIPPMSADASVFANRLAFRMNLAAVPAGVGEAYAETLFRLTPRLIRKPDMAFVPYAVWPRDRPVPRANGWPVVPALCVEVVSPTDSADEVRGKVDLYFEAGVRVVWVVYPQHRLVDVYETADRVRVLRRADALDGGPVLPGFALPLAELFPEPEPQR